MIRGRANLKLEFGSAKHARAIYLALSPELEEREDRAEVSLNLRKKEIELKVKAKDAASFRAAASSYLRWIKTAHTLIE